MDAKRLGVAIAAVVLASTLLPAQLFPGDIGSAPAADVPTPIFFAAAPEVVSTPDHPVLSRVHYYAVRDEEFVTIGNPTAIPWDLGNWTLTDREGTVTIPTETTLGAGDELVLTYNATSYREEMLEDPTFTYKHGEAARAATTGSFLLRNGGDEVLLGDDAGNLVDAFVYGSSTYDGNGWGSVPAVALNRGKVAVRVSASGVVRDTDTAADWDQLRSFGLGQSSFPAPRWTITGAVRPFLAPDESLDVVSAYIDDAHRTIDWSTYTFNSAVLAERFRSARDRGVAVRILLEGQPVGGLDERSWEIVANLSAAGAHVRFLADDSANRSLARYRFNHAKFAVVDRETTLVFSENSGDHGFPVPPRSGNRGWGIAVENRTVADWFSDVFDADFEPSRRDSVALDNFHPDLVPYEGDLWKGRPLSEPRLGSRIAGRFEVMPILGPDTTLDPNGIRGWLASAARSLNIELFYTHPSWESHPNVYLDEALRAARRGVSVHILLDDSWYNSEGVDGDGNDDTVSWLNEIAAVEGLDLEAKLGRSAAHGILKFHTKGFVVDEEAVVISSVNWNLNSVTANREVGLLVRHPEVAAFFLDAFRWDWKDDVVRPWANAGPDLLGYAGQDVVLSAIGSFDDQGIVAYEWDLDGDGVADRTGPTVTVQFREPGTYLVRLRVEDRAGNEDNDTARVTIVATVGHPGEVWWNPLLGPVVLLSVLNTALLSRTFSGRRRRGKGINGDRGMNRRGGGPVDFRGGPGEVRLLSAELVALPGDGGGDGPGDLRGRGEARGGQPGSQGP